MTFRRRRRSALEDFAVGGCSVRAVRYTDDALSEHGFRMEKVDLLRKPFSPQELIDRVEQFLGVREEE